MEREIDSGYNRSGATDADQQELGRVSKHVSSLLTLRTSLSLMGPPAILVKMARPQERIRIR